MKFQEHKATLADLMAIIDDPSETTAAEAQAAGYSRWTLLKALRVRLHDGEATAVRLRGKPLFVVGHYPDPLRNDNRIMWFVAAQDWFALGARSVLYGRRFMCDLRRRYPGSSFTSISWSRHPDLNRWFAFQGFVIEERAGQASVFKCAKQG